MNDRVPGSSYDNPVWYRGYRIYISDNIDGYEFVHDNYDGAEDSGDNRCGYETTIERCKEAIDEKEDD